MDQSLKDLHQEYQPSTVYKCKQECAYTYFCKRRSVYSHEEGYEQADNCNLYLDEYN